MFFIFINFQRKSPAIAAAFAAWDPRPQVSELSHRHERFQVRHGWLVASAHTASPRTAKR
jgi:hypothetical protein